MDWSGLPADVLRLVAGRVALHADYLSLRATCSSWRAAALPDPPHLSPRLPFLLSFTPSPPLIYPVTNPRRAHRFPFRPPNLAARCVGSSHGHLAVVGPGPSLSLVDPFSPAAAARIDLPPATAIPFLFDGVGASDVHRCRADSKTAGDSWWWHFVHKVKVCYSSRPAARGGGTPGAWLVVAFPKSGLAVWRPGDAAWARVGRLWRFADAEFCNGSLYAITRGGILSTVEVCKPDAAGKAPAFKENVLVSTSPFTSGDNVTPYLVESEKELLLVVRKHSYNLADPQIRCTSGFKVFKLAYLKDGDPMWQPVFDLGDRMLVVESGTSVSLPVHGLSGCRPNCVYFSENCDDASTGIVSDSPYAVFSISEGHIERVDCHSADTYSSPPPSAIWITPSLW